MERNPEQLHANPDAIALGTMRLRSHDEIIAYRPDGGIDALRFIETGEVTIQSYTVGGKTMSFEVESREPIMCDSYDSWRDYALAAGSDITGDEPKPVVWRGNGEHDPEFDGAREAILTTAVEQAAGLEDCERIEPCQHGCDAGMRTLECMCLELRNTYTTIDGERFSEPKPKGEPDPTCQTCSGSGEQTLRCYYCLGSGEAIVNPLITIMNDSTGSHTTFRLEVAELLASGDAELMIERERLSYRNGEPLPPALRATLDIETFMRRKALEIGIDIDGEYTTYWGTRPLETFGTTFGHLLRQISTSIRTPDEFASTADFTEAALGELQRRLHAEIRTDIYGVNRQRDPAVAVQAEGKLFDIDFNDNLTVSHVGLRLGQAVSPNKALRELIDALDSRNYRLGFAYTGIATGESGPALYVLDQSGNVLSEIDSGYEERTVLEGAYGRIRELLEFNLDDTDNEAL